MSKISVLVPTFKEPDCLDLCLRSCIEGCSDPDNIEIIVGVDGHYDVNKDVLDKWSSYIKLLIMDENVGLVRMTNLLVYNASNPLILIVNDDNVFDFAWNKKLLDSYEENSIITPNQIEPFKSIFPQFIIDNLGRDPQTFDLEYFWQYVDSYNGNKVDNTGSTFPIFMSKMDFLRVGGWDECYEGGVVVDWDFFLKCKLSGMQTLRTYKTHFYHFVSVSTNNTIEKMNARMKQEMQNHEYAKYKWGNYIKQDPRTNSKFL